MCAGTEWARVGFDLSSLSGRFAIRIKFVTLPYSFEHLGQCPVTVVLGSGRAGAHSDDVRAIVRQLRWNLCCADYSIPSHESLPEGDYACSA